jgi:hypothetical protein
VVITDVSSSETLAWHRDCTRAKHVARVCEPAAGQEPTDIHDVCIKEAYSFSEMVALVDDAPNTDIDPEYVECLFDGSVYDTVADASKFREITGWVPEIRFEEGVERVRTPYREAAAPETNEAGRDRERECMGVPDLEVERINLLWTTTTDPVYCCSPRA